MTFQKVRLIVGLGNPGQKYERTRHNVGKRVAERLRSYGKHPLGAEFFTTEDFMNTSGFEVSRFMARKGIAPEETLVVLDDFEIPLGRLRIRMSGSHGGHNGLKSVLEQLSTESVPRLRIGIGPVAVGQDPADFVLEKFSRAQELMLETVLVAAEDAVNKSISEGVEVAMNQFNNRVL